jgi:signal transduction histidine kinase
MGPRQESAVAGEGTAETLMIAAAMPRILVVDDDPRSLYALKELLETPEQSVLVAQSGEEALQCVRMYDFAVIVLDVRMPGINGFEAARLIRQRERSRFTPIIFLTAAAEDLASVLRGYGEVGAVDYLIKPIVVPEVLRSKVAMFVEFSKHTADLNRQINEPSRAEERLHRSEEQLRRLAGYLISVREEERCHIAREIHDELGQVLTGLKMDVTWLAKRLKDDQRLLLEKTESMSHLIDGAIQTVRKIAAGLRPEVLDNMGLVPAVAWQAKEFQKRTGIRCRVKLPPETAKLGLDPSTTTFRILQEILTNVARHSRATRVDVCLRVSKGRLALEVADNGVGISQGEVHGKRSLGLVGMRERALLVGGEVNFSGAPGQGTKVTVSIPI